MCGRVFALCKIRQNQLYKVFFAHPKSTLGAVSMEPMSQSHKQSIIPPPAEPPRKCWRGAGWLTAAWIKFLSTDDAVAAAIYNRLMTNSMDAETLRWFSPAQLNKVDEKIFK